MSAMLYAINQWPLPAPVLGVNEPGDWLNRLQSLYMNFEERGATMSRKSVYCLAATDAEAAVIYQRLKEEGFSDQRITVLVRDETGGSHDYSPDPGVNRSTPVGARSHAKS